MKLPPAGSLLKVACYSLWDAPNAPKRYMYWLVMGDRTVLYNDGTFYTGKGSWVELILKDIAKGNIEVLVD